MRPVFALPAGGRVQFLGVAFERGGVRTLTVDLHQLGTHGMPARILEQGFLENLLGLRITPISHVDIGFGHRVDLVGIDRSAADLAEIALERTVAGIDILAAGIAKHRVGLEIPASDDAVFKLLDFALAAHRIGCIPAEQREDTAATGKIRRIVQKLVHQARLRRRRRWWGSRLLRRGLGRIRSFRRVCGFGRFGNLGRFGGLGGLACGGRFRCFRRLCGLCGFGCFCGIRLGRVRALHRFRCLDRFRGFWRLRRLWRFKRLGRLHRFGWLDLGDWRRRCRLRNRRHRSGSGLRRLGRFFGVGYRALGDLRRCRRAGLALCLLLHV